MAKTQISIMHSIGIELVNRGHRLGYEKFTKNQIKNLILLCSNLKKYKIKNENFLGHQISLLIEK